MKNNNNSTPVDSASKIEELEAYAKATNSKLLQTISDLGNQTTLLRCMVVWCKKQSDIVVLCNGAILSSNPTSRDVQNCKTLLLKKGVLPGRVFAATQTLLSLLLARVSNEVQKETKEYTRISDKQYLLRSLINEAISKQASDIHIEVRKQITVVRMRQHGELLPYCEWPSDLGRAVAAVAFNKETDHATSHFNPLVAQDAAMPLDIEGKKVRLRLASVPAHGGFDMVMRVLTTGEECVQPLQELGYTEQHVELITKAISYPHGAIVIAGPTGSGKTTTLASCMSLVTKSRKIYSIEDPVEKVVANATQVPVNIDKDDRSFASMGRAALRMDPDLIVLGETRDSDTSQVMVRAAITGHLVLTTVHANSALGIITRLKDLGVSSSLLSDGNVLRLLVYQRLAVTLCPHCKQPLTEANQYQDVLPQWQTLLGDLQTVCVRGEGCQQCRFTAIAGRTVLAEVVWMDDPGREYIHNHDLPSWQKHLKQQSWQDYEAHAISLIKKGVCDPFDIEKVIGCLFS